MNVTLFVKKAFIDVSELSISEQGDYFGFSKYYLNPEVFLAEK